MGITRELGWCLQWMTYIIVFLIHVFKELDHNGLIVKTHSLKSPL